MALNSAVLSHKRTNKQGCLQRPDIPLVFCRYGYALRWLWAWCWLGVLSACSSAPLAPAPALAPTPLPLPTLDPTWERFTSFDQLYAYARPTNWTYQITPGATILFDVPERAGFATTLLDAPLDSQNADFGKALVERLSTQAARNGEQFQLVTQGGWAMIPLGHHAIEHRTSEPTQKINTYHVTFMLATPKHQTLFVQYFRLDTTELTPAERQMLQGVMASFQFAQ